MNRFVAIAFAVVLGASVSACAKHDASSSTSADASAVASDGAASAAAAASSAAPDGAAPNGAATATPSVSASNGVVTFTQGKNSITMGKAGTTDIGIPLYPKATTQDGTSIDATENGVRTRMVVLTTSDNVDAIKAWYESQIGDYHESGFSIGDAKTVTFKSGDESTLPFKTVIVAPHNDGASIELIVKEKT